MPGYKTLVKQKGRVCTKCGKFREWKYYHSNGKGGKKSKCSDCVRLYQQTRRKSNLLPKSTSGSPYEINAHGRECIACGIFKPWVNEIGEESFQTYCDGSYGYNGNCKVCMSTAGWYKIVACHTIERGNFIKRKVLDDSLLQGHEYEGMEVEFYANKKRPSGERYKVVGTQYEKQELVRVV